ncbi:hypothetical protein ACIRVF_11440 [Kitasatospora sp. NPDC101157]|uniref:hypothetical protein n=1 Tax=Kitasatospora sp. NPDC101157 TaxID=3364098 RepID=UPI003805B17E
MRNFIVRMALVSAMVGSFYVGYLADHPPTPSPSVGAFNDGFEDAKWDDCQQGYAAACDWLHDRR